MIVLDESITDRVLIEAIENWYAGKVIGIAELRPRTIIKDEAIPTLLTSQTQPTFITTNAPDFWRKLAADKRYCILCFVLSDSQLALLPDLLRRVLSLPEFKTKTARCGKIGRVATDAVRFYEANQNVEQEVSW